MPSTPSFSVEFFPPKDLAGEARLWASLDALAPYKPDFVSVTYGAGGSTRDRTIRITSEITKRTGLPTVAHLTCVGSTEEELRETLKNYGSAGITSVLALRGDPEGGPASKWQSTAGGLDHADQLVSLARELGFEVGVAAFPDKHPASSDLNQDIEVLLEKERRGASFATTQFFFGIEKYLELKERLRARNSKLPLIAGILPITNVKQLERMALLSGTPIPQEVSSRINQLEPSPELVKAEGVAIAAELAQALIAAGAPGIHFYTMNSADSTIEIVKRVGLR
ncbi:MAG: methylenetetrahydrofolate reductase [NAD(P)H] [Candidatus Nanopelagicaceae bacterium]|nr:methylenetetrahydrofolate reductase [NAD(P)H] [Candidatus Nanopelagicaceae bacterium]